MQKDQAFYSIDIWIHHFIGVMHLEKNVFYRTIGTLVAIPSKTNDGLKSRNVTARPPEPRSLDHPMGGPTYTYHSPYTFILALYKSVNPGVILVE